MGKKGKKGKKGKLAPFRLRPRRGPATIESDGRVVAEVELTIS